LTRMVGGSPSGFSLVSNQMCRGHSTRFTLSPPARRGSLLSTSRSEPPCTAGTAWR
jgi:hypothetical protein